MLLPGLEGSDTFTWSVVGAQGRTAAVAAAAVVIIRMWLELSASVGTELCAVFSDTEVAVGNRAHLSGELLEASLLWVDGAGKEGARKGKHKEAGAESLGRQGWKCRSREENQINVMNGAGRGTGQLRKTLKRKFLNQKPGNIAIHGIWSNLSYRDFTNYRAHLHLWVCRRGPTTKPPE